MRRLVPLVLLAASACATTRPLPGAAPPVAAAPQPAPTPAPAPVPARAPFPPPGFSLRIRAAGDVMLGTGAPEPDLPPEDGKGSLAAVKALLADADLTFVNLEGPLCDGGSTNKCRPGQNCYAFRVPTRYGAYLQDAGVDVVSTANNHSGDFGEECRRATESTLDGLGIRWSGPPGSIATLEVKGARIALVAFHTSASCNDLNDTAAAQELVKKAKAGSDLVIVSFHGGAEGAKAQHVPEGHEMFYGEDRGDLRGFARAMIDAGADLVLGHGPHVVRGMEVVQGHLVVYSMGNFATYGRFNLSGPTAQGMIVEVELDGRGLFTRGRILPTRLRDRGIPEPDLEGAAIELTRSLTAQDFPATGAVIEKDGTIRPASPPVEATR